MAERQWQGRQLQNGTGRTAVAAQRSCRSNVVAEAQSQPQQSERSQKRRGSSAVVVSRGRSAVAEAQSPKVEEAPSVVAQMSQQPSRSGVTKRGGRSAEVAEAQSQ